MDPATIAVLRQQVAALRARLAYDDCIALAVQERTGEPCEPGDPYTAADAARAREIFERCYRAENISD